MNIAFGQVSNFGIQNLNSVKSTPAANTTFKAGLFDDFSTQYDFFTKNETIKKEPPKISMVRVLFHRLTKEQIQNINENRELPKNAKFVDSDISGEPKLTWNLLDWTKGTHTLPAGYELKQDILGFTHVVREDSKAWYLKKDKTH